MAETQRAHHHALFVFLRSKEVTITRKEKKRREEGV